MKLIAENIDIYPDTLIDVIDVTQGIICKEKRDYDDNKRIRNIIDDLDSFNLSITIQDVDMIKYSLLLAIDNISVELIDSEIKFKNIDFNDEELNNEYNRLLKQYESLAGLIDMPDKILQYIQPSSRLVDVRLSMSIKDFVYFIITCSKYDELIDINVLLSNYDELLDKLVTMANSLNDMYIPDDLFIRLKLDEENRKLILNSGNINIIVVSNEEYIYHCIANNKTDVKLSTLCSCSLVGYRELVKFLPNHHVKIENFFDLIEQEYINLTLPVEYLNINEDISNAINGYIYDWFLLFDKVKKYDELELEAMLCCLGCFSSICKINTTINDYYKLSEQSELSEVSDIMAVLEQKISIH